MHAKIASVGSKLRIVVAVLLSLAIRTSAQIDTLYGIVNSGPYEGYLIKIDTATGHATAVGDTGLSMPCVLAYNSSDGVLLTSNCSGYPPQGFALDPNTGASSLIIDVLSPNLELEYADDALYGLDPGVGASVLIKLNPETGSWIEDVGVINKGPANQLAFDPIRHVMYGTGMSGGNNWLFTITLVHGPPPLETDVARVGRLLSGLAFSSNGTLYATDGKDLFIMDKSTGTLTEVGPFGSEIGFVSDIAFVPGGLIRFPHIKLHYTPTNYAIWGLVAEGMPWCPPGLPGCSGNRLSIDVPDTEIPPYISKLGEAVRGVARARSDPKSLDMALNGLREVVPSIPSGLYFDRMIRDRFVKSIDNAIQQKQKVSPVGLLESPVFVQSINAIELDWRLPKLKTAEVGTDKYVGIDLNGVVWAGLRDVVGRGVISLSIENEYAAFPIGSSFSPTWPFLSYRIDLDAKLASKGFIDLVFYVKPLQFKNGISTIRVLQLDNGHLVDVTSGADRSRGTVMARTDHPGTFIVVGKD